MSQPINYNQPPKGVLTQLINLINQTQFTVDQLEFKNVRPHTAAGGDTTVQNTDVDVRVLATDVTETVNYGRIDLAKRKGIAGGVARIPYEARHVSPVNVLQEINELTGLQLSGEDVLNSAFENLSESELPYSFILRARDTSLLVHGQVEITLVDRNETAPPTGGDDDADDTDPAPVDPPAPTPVPAVLGEQVALSATPEETIEGDTVAFELELEFVGNAPSTDGFVIDLAFDGLTFDSEVAPVAEGFTIVGDGAAASITVAAGIESGTYTIGFTAVAAPAAEQEVLTVAATIEGEPLIDVSVAAIVG